MAVHSSLRLEMLYNFCLGSYVCNQDVNPPNLLATRTYCSHTQDLHLIGRRRLISLHVVAMARGMGLFMTAISVVRASASARS